MVQLIQKNFNVITKEGECKVSISLDLNINLNTGKIELPNSSNETEEEEEEKTEWAIPDFAPTKSKLHFGKNE